MSKENIIDNAKEVDSMNAAAENSRTCTISESIIKSCQEVKLMRDGKSSKHDLRDLFLNIEKWSKEERE